MNTPPSADVLDAGGVFAPPPVPATVTPSINPPAFSFVSAPAPAQTIVANFTSVHGDVTGADVTRALSASGYTAYTAPADMRQALADYFKAHIEHFTSSGQRVLDAFINPSIANGKEIWDGFSAGGAQPALMNVANPFGYYQIVYGHVAKNDPSPRDIGQGRDGDCWYDSSLGALANAQLLKASKDGGITFDGRPFMTPRSDGKLEVTFQIWNTDGSFTPQTVVIDRSLPEYASSALYDTNADLNALWPAYAEKAAAVLRGNTFDGINGGWEYDALTLISGWLPSMRWTGGADPTDMFNYMKAALAAGSPVAASTYPMTADDQAAFIATGMPPDGSGETGVVTSHVYMVLDVAEKDGQKFVKLQNPWGFHEPLVGSNNGRNDGTFWLPMSVFMQTYQEASTIRRPGTSSDVLATPGAVNDYFYAGGVAKKKPTPPVRDARGHVIATAPKMTASKTTMKPAPKTIRQTKPIVSSNMR